MVQVAKMDMRSWNALYQQQPAADVGDYFKADWFGEYESMPESLAIYGASDYAVTEGGGDYTEHGIFGLDPMSNLYVLDWWRGQETADVWIDRQCDLIVKHKPLTWFGEAGPIRRAIEPFMLRRFNERRAFVNMEWMASIADKPTRARNIQALASMGKVFFPKNAVWKSDVIGQALRFPAGKHDDAVDVLSLVGRALEHVQPPYQKKDRPTARQIASNQGWMG
jgi:predicted phage terminase large subunit-like protein